MAKKKTAEVKPEPKAPPLRPALALSVLAGVLYFVGYVGYGQLYLTWVCFIPGLLALRGQSPRRAFWLWTALGFVMTVGGFYWITLLLTQFANLPLPVAIFALALMAFQQGVGLGLVGYSVRRLELKSGVPVAFSLPLALTAQELLYPQLFPFYIGASQYKFTLITQIVELTGVVGLATLIGLVNGALYETLEARRLGQPLVRSRLLPAAAAVVFALGFGAIRVSQIDAASAAAPKLKVALVQTNLGAKDKHERAAEFIERHRRMTAETLRAHPELDLVVWPESAYNGWIQKGTPSVSDPVTQGLNKPILFGALTWDRGPDGPRGYNSAVLTSSTGAVLGTFDKVVLLMFGETLPFAETFPILKKWFPQSSTFTAGTTFRHLRMREGPALLPMVCYEDLMPGFVRKMWDLDGPADALVNVTNDSWYGDSDEPLEHLTLALFRSIETRRSLIRSTNTGISALVDPAGRLVARSGQWTQETLIGEVPLLKSPEKTVYLRVGDLFGFSLSAALAWLHLRRAQPRP
ncbi:MAG: apolipoprotein N-acyltransferase [Myxococcota bacterium]